MKITGKILILIIKGYQLIISPLFGQSCRFYPTCSQYSIDSIKKHGGFRGGWMAVKRIARCHPFSKGGYDPVK